jgi:plastocyanin
MRHTRRTLLASGAATLAAGLAGCSGQGDTGGNGDGTEAEGTPTGDTDGSQASTVEVSAGTALAAEWNVMRARLHDAAALSRTGRTPAAAALVGDVFARFERSTGEFGAHEGLEATDEATYDSFEEHLGDARSAFEDGDTDAAIAAVDGAEAELSSAQRARAGETAADVFGLFTFGSRVRNVGALAAAGSTDAAAAVGERVFSDFESAPAHGTLESAGEGYHEAFEGPLVDAIDAAEGGDPAGVHEATRSASEAVVDAAYDLVPEAVAGVGHLSLFGAVGFDAEMAASAGGPGVGLAHAAGLNGYRARVRDAAWLYDAGETEAARTAAQSILREFEAARAHEALEEASESAYTRFEDDGLGALLDAIGDGDDAGVEEAVTTVHDALTEGITALAGEDAPVLESGFFRARLGDARERYERGDAEVAATIAEALFARFERNEADIHETLESTSESLYGTFEEEHLTALPDAFRAGDDGAVDTHLAGATDALVEFEAAAGSTPSAGAAAATYMTGRACDGGVLSAIGATDRAGTVTGDAFAYFEAGANGFHEAVEDASEERYHSFEEALGAVRTAANGGADAYDAATTFAGEATAAVYAVVEHAGGGSDGGDVGASTLVSDAFATFENARVHEALEAGDEATYETFEDALSAYVSALESGEGVDAAGERYAQATRNAAFAVAGHADDAPELSVDGAGGAGSEDDAETELRGGPNVVEGVPEEADHVVEMHAVAFEPAELTVSAGDTVAWQWAGGEPHNVVAYGAELPEGATYWASGGFDSEAAARTGWENGEGAVQSGESYVHTFETTGTHEYVCVPHEAAGMVGTIVVE